MNQNDQAPKTSTDAFYITGGNVPADALSYVTRDADARLLQHLLQGDFCYILTSRQMGKSSLMTHMVKRLREHQVAPAVLDLSSQGFSLTGEQWYNGLLEQLGRRLKIEDAIEDFCQEHPHLSPLQLWQSALREVVLQTLTTPVVIFIDEIDVVRSLTFSTDEFFAAIRACYNARTEDPAFTRLSFCLLGVATPADLIANPRLTPFNIGTRIELSDFSREEASGLSHGLGPNAETNRVLLDRIYYWTGGHPYLTQRLCQAVAANDANLTAGSVDACAERLFLSSKAQRQDSNLMFVQQRMLPAEEEQRVGLLRLYGKVLSGKGVVADSETGAYVSELKLAGIVAAAEGQLRVRNRIYAQVFGKGWIEENLPGAEVRRLREAYRRGLVRAGAVASAIVGVMGLLTLWAIHAQQQANNFRVKADEAAATAKTQSAMALQQRQVAERIAYIANMNLISGAYDANQFDRVGELLDETNQEKYKPYRGFEWGYWNRLAHLELLALKGHTEDVDEVAFSRDRQRILTTSVKEAKVWDAHTGREVLTLSRPASGFHSVAFSPDGQRILAMIGGETKVCDAQTGLEVVALNRLVRGVSLVAYSRNGQRIATSSDKFYNGKVKVWDAQTGRELRTLQGHKFSISSVEFAPDGRSIMTLSDKILKVWNAQTGRELMGLNEDSYPAVFSPDGQRILTTHGPEAKVWEVQTGREILALTGHENTIYAATFSPNGRWIATGSVDKTAKVWDAQTGKDVVTLKGHTDDVRMVVFSSNSRSVVTGSDDKTAKVWDVQTGREIMTLKGHTSRLTSAAFSPDGRLIVTGSADKTVKVWDAQTGRKTLALNDGGDASSVSFSPDGQRIVTGSDDNTAKVMDAQTGRELMTLKGHKNEVMSVAFSPNGQRIVTGSEDKTAKVWNAQTGLEIVTLKGHKDKLWGTAFSPDSQRVVTGCNDGTAKVWDAQTGKEILTFKGHEEPIRSVAFSPDGMQIVTGSQDETVKVWDSRTGQKRVTLKGHTSCVSSVAFSPDGQQIVSGSLRWENLVKVWDVGTGRELMTLKGHTGSICSVAFSPDGKRIVSYADEVKVWDAQTGREVLELKEFNKGIDLWSLGSVAFSPDGRRIATASGKSVNVWFSDPKDWNVAMSNTNRVNAHISLAETLVKAKKYEEAVAEYKAALRLRLALGDGTFLGTLGWYEYLAGHIDDAIKSSRSALEKDPTLTYVGLNLGLCYATQNDWPKAKQEYDLALKTAPKATLKAGIEDVQAAIKKHANPALAKALAYLQKAGGK